MALNIEIAEGAEAGSDVELDESEGTGGGGLVGGLPILEPVVRNPCWASRMWLRPRGGG